VRPLPTARPCPWCRGANGRRIWSEGAYDYARCSRCGGVFANLTGTDYERVRHNVWDEQIPNQATIAFYDAGRDRAHREFLNRNPPFGNRRLLDVGCGLGVFLERARQRGWDVRGVDSSPAWVELANERLGAPVVEQARIEQAELPRASFALITAWDVIEHVFDPIPFLTHLRSLLAPGGRLFLRTPNVSYVYPVYALRRSMLHHDVELGPTNHVVYFSARTMRCALRRSGLSACDWRVYPPPQVGLTFAKNPYARVTGAVARLSRGHPALGSDLDVMCG
jgi:2-polyprenyl-3-methyl-5-hydroxy-6-metoxy-1,4-benzoquinol methylase